MEGRGEGEEQLSSHQKSTNCVIRSKSINGVIGWKKIGSKITIGITPTECARLEIGSFLVSNIISWFFVFWWSCRVVMRQIQTCICEYEFLVAFHLPIEMQFPMVSTPPIFADSAGLTIIIINWVCAFVNVSWIETFEQGFHLNVSLDASQLGISLATTTSRQPCLSTWSMNLSHSGGQQRHLSNRSKD